MSLMITSYTKALRSYDRDLFVGHTKDGVACVLRKYKRFEPICEWDGGKLSSLVEEKQFVFALTDNWNMSGRPREWGIDFVLARIKEIDIVANLKLFDELDAHNEKVDESKKRDMRNKMESFLIDERSRFAKATDGILTHSLSKDEPKKRLKDRSIKNGNY